jgi:hypothetical protein
MKRLLSFLTSFVVLIVPLLTLPLPVSADACFTPGDQCIDLNETKHCCSPVGGKRYSCQGNTPNPRNVVLPTCREDATIPIDLNCTCDHSLQEQTTKINGNNGFTCSGKLPDGKTASQHTFCSSNVNCVANPGAVIIAPGIWGGQPAKDVQCKVVTYEPPKPPQPPCQHFNLNGGCDVVGSSIGQLNTQPGPFIIRMLNILLGAGGGIAAILIMRAGYQLMSSQGNPEGIQKGREQLIAAIVGLLFLIFSFVLFQTIAVDILKVPGITP